MKRRNFIKTTAATSRPHIMPAIRRQLYLQNRVFAAIGAVVGAKFHKSFFAH